MGKRYNDKEEYAEVDCDQGGQARSQEEGTNCSETWLRNVRPSHSNSKVANLYSLFPALAGVSVLSPQWAVLMAFSLALVLAEGRPG